MFKKSLKLRQFIFLHRKINDLSSRNKVYIRLASDIHLETGLKSNFKIRPITFKSKLTDNPKKDTTVCILAGDIGDPCLPSYSSFLRETKKHFDKVFVTSGNHEYSFNETNETDLYKKKDKIDWIIKNICKKEDCHYLCNQEIQIENYWFAGCTLWSDISSNQVIKQVLEKTEKQKYSESRDGVPTDTGRSCFASRRRSEASTPSLASPCKLVENPIVKNEEWGQVIKRLFKKTEKRKYLEFHYDNFKKDVDWIQSVLKKRDNVVLVTHFAPSFSVISEQFKHYKNQQYFASNLEHLFKHPLKIWCHGHTHGSISTRINDIPLLSNCVGHSAEYSNFNPDRVITLP